MKTRNRELRRRRARRDKTKQIKARIATTSDSKLKVRLMEKLRRVNLYLDELWRGTAPKA